MKKRIIILGSTGSIGKSCLDVIRNNRKRFEVVGLASHKNVVELEKQIREFKPKKVSVASDKAFTSIKKAGLPKTGILGGAGGAVELVESLKADVVVSAIVGASGLLPTFAAIRKGVRIGLANKESLVMAGGLIISKAKREKVEIIPVDSEHSAIWQCLNGEPRKRVAKLVLTASGGPFLRMSTAKMKKITPAQALKHPRWKMGPKITIDSSTLMNKGLEVIEAHWLFNMPVDGIDVVIHPQSIVHSMVEFTDTSVMAQLGLPDMRVPIAYALSYPDRWPATGFRGLDISRLGKLEFIPPDKKKFPCLDLAYRAIKKGGILPAALNAANEIAVKAFLDGKIRHVDIPVIIEKTMESTRFLRAKSIKSIIDADSEARQKAAGYI